MIPRKDNYLLTRIRPNPDLYGTYTLVVFIHRKSPEVLTFKGNVLYKNVKQAYSEFKNNIFSFWFSFFRSILDMCDISLHNCNLWQLVKFFRF